MLVRETSRGYLKKIQSLFPKSIRRERIISLGILTIAFFFLILIYAPGLREDLFLIDDGDLILVPFIKANFDFELFKTWITPGSHIDFYPIRDLTYWMDIHLLGGDPTGTNGIVFRLQNFVWVFISSVLLSEILKHLKVKEPYTSLAAAAWMLHPVHSELLMWPSARKDCLAIAFGLGATYFYFRHIERKDYKWGTLAAFSFCLGLFSKISIALIPLVIPVIGALQGKECIHWRKKNVIIWLPSIVISLLVLFGQTQFYGSVNDMRFVYSYDYRIQASLIAFGRSLLGWVYPFFNAVDVENWGNWIDLNRFFLLPGIVLFLVSLGFTFFVLFQRRTLASSIVVCFWLTFLPVSAWIFPHRNFYSVRYFEVPVLILCVGLMIYLSSIRFNTWIARTALPVLFILLFLGDISEAKVWMSGVSPFLKGLQITPNNPSLLRMALDQILNQERWGKLDQENYHLKAKVSQELQTLCSSQIESEKVSFRNSHLCLGLWLDASLDTRSLHLPSQSISWAIQSLKDVNPHSAHRAGQRLQIQKKLQSGENLDLTENMFNGKTIFNLNTPESRLKYWAALCLYGKADVSADLIRDWKRKHLVDSYSVAEFLTQYQNSKFYADRYKSQVKECYRLSR